MPDRRMVANWRVMRVIMETPFEILLSLMSVYVGAVILAYQDRAQLIPTWLLWATAADILVGGVVTFIARFGRTEFVRMERSGLALLVVGYASYATYYLNLVGVSVHTFGNVIAEYALALGFAIRCWTLGIGLRANKGGA